MNLGININTKDGIDKANQEIKDWLSKLQGDIDKNKLKISFDMPKDLEDYLTQLGDLKTGTRDLEKSSLSLKDRLKELEETWGSLSAKGRAGGLGKDLISEWKEISEEADGLDSSLRQAVNSVDKYQSKIDEASRVSEHMTTKMKELETAWNSLTVAERKGAEGQEIISRWKELIDSSDGMDGSLRQVVKSMEDYNRKTEEAEKASGLMVTRMRELEAAWEGLTAEQRGGAAGVDLMNSWRELVAESKNLDSSLKQAVKTIDAHEQKTTESARAARHMTTKLKDLEDAWGRLSAAERQGVRGQFLISEWQKLNEQAGGLSGSLRQASKATEDYNRKVDEAEKASRSMSFQLKEMEEVWASLSAEERAGVFGQELVQAWRELTAESNSMSGTLRQTVSALDSRIQREQEAAESAGLLSTKIKNLEQEWSKLNERERQSSEGDILKSKYKALTESAGGYTATLKSAVAQEEKMQRELKRSADAEKNKQQALEKQALYLRTYKGQLEELERQWAKLNAEQRKGAEGQQVIANVKRLNESYGEYKGTLTQIISEEDRRNKALQKTGKIMSQLKNITASYLSLYTGIRLTKQIADITGEFEIQKNAIAAMLNSAERAEVIFTQIKELAIVSPFEVKDLVSYAKQLTAFSVPYEELYDTTKRLADISSGLGVDMGRLILAFGQVRSAAVLRGQELRQFTEAGIPLIDELVRKFRELGEEVSQADIFDKIYQRKVPFEMVRDVLFEMTEEGGKFYRMQEVQAETLKGKITNLADAYDIFLAKIGESGSPIMGGFVDLLKELMENHEALTIAVLAGASSFGIAKIASVGLATSLLNVGVAAEKLWLILAKNQWIALATVVTGAAFALARWYKEATKVERAHKELIGTLGELEVRVETEAEAFKTAFMRMEDAEKGTIAHEKAKENLHKKYGDYLKDLGLELDAVQSNTQAYKDLVSAIESSSRVRAALDFTEQMEASFSKQKGEAWVKIFKGLIKSGLSETVANEIVNDFKAQAKQMEEEGKVVAFRLNTMYSSVSKKRVDTSVLKGLDEELKAHEYYIEQKKQRTIAFGELENKTDNTVTSGRIHNVNKLLKELKGFEDELAKIQAPAWDADTTIGLTDEDIEKIRGLNESIKMTKDSLAELGYTEPKKGREKTVDELKLMLDAMKKEIDTYTRQVSIWEALQKPYDKSLETFLNEQLRELGVEIGDKDVLDIEWKDVIFGKDLEPQVEDMARSIFNTLQDNALKAFQDSEKQLKDFTDKYGTYADKINQINKKYQDDISKMREAGMSDEQINVAMQARQKEVSSYIETYAKESEDFQEFLFSIANISEDKIGELLEKIRALMDATAAASGHDSEEYVKLRAMFDELAEKADKLKPKDKTYEQWRKLQTVLNRTSKSFDEIGDSIGGVGGEAFSLAGELATTTVSIIDSIELLTTSSADAMAGAGDAAVTTLQKVEKASVILAIITAAIKVVQKIIEFTKKLFNRKHDREIKRQQAAIKALQNEYKQLQHEMKRAFGGDYFRQANAQIENLKKQQEALNKQLEAEQKKSSKKSKKQQEELKDEILENQMAIEDALSDMVERMAGTSLASAARSFADAWADAYYSFEDTSKAIEDRFREMARNMVLENVISGRIGKILEPSFKYIENALKDGVMSESEMKVWLGMMENANKVMQSESVYWEQIVESMGDLLDRGKGESNLSGIAKGIANASEDTVLLVGGYLDSIRFKLFPYIDYMMGDFTTTINLIMNTQIQQVNHLREIELATKDTSRSNRELVDAINSVIEIGDNGKRLKV